MLYVIAITGVPCLSVFKFCLCITRSLSLKYIFLSSVLVAFSLYPLARSAFWSLIICCLKFPSSELVRRILCASPSAMLFSVPLG